MIYQVTATLFFEVEDEAVDFYHDCELAFAKSTIINPEAPNIEYSQISLIHNNHDLDPNQPCELIAHRDNLPV